MGQQNTCDMDQPGCFCFLVPGKMLSPPCKSQLCLDMSFPHSAFLSFLPDMTWLNAGCGDPVQCCCLPTPDHPAPQQCPPPDAAAAEDQWLIKGNWVSSAYTGQCQFLPQHVSLLHQSRVYVSLFSRHRSPDTAASRYGRLAALWGLRGILGPAGQWTSLTASMWASSVSGLLECYKCAASEGYSGMHLSLLK